MSITQHPNGVSSFGVPILGSGNIISTGKFFFVDSNTGSNSNSGSDPAHALATIDYAVGLCTANSGDHIIVMEGHTESLTGATSLVVDVAGVTIIGLGHGNARPLLDFDDTDATIEMDAADCILSNVVLRASVSAVVVGVNCDADGITLDRVETTWEATGDDFVTMIDIDAFDRCTVQNCKLYTEPAVAGCAEAIRVDDAHNTRIIRNEIIGTFSDSPIAGEGAASNDCLVVENYLCNQDTTDNNGMEWVVASTGLMARNYIGTLYATGVAALVDPGSFLCVENYAVNAIDETGVIVPTVAST